MSVHPLAGTSVKTCACHMKGIGGKINHQRSFENKNATILWDFDIHTDRKIHANRSDLIAKNHMKKLVFSMIFSCLMITMYHSKSLKN